MVKGEQSHGGLDHLGRLGDDASAAPETGTPVPLAGIVALATLGLILADVVPPRRQSRIVGRPVVGTEQAYAPRLQAPQQTLERDRIAAFALPVNQPACVAFEGLPDPEFAGVF